MFFVQTLFAENRARFCTKWKNSNLCRLFLPKIGWGSARNSKTGFRADFFYPKEGGFLHEFQKRDFVQTFFTQNRVGFCTKLNNRDLCRLFLPRSHIFSARNCKIHFYAENARRTRHNLLQKIQKSQNVQNFARKLHEIFCTKLENRDSCRIACENTGACA